MTDKALYQTSRAALSAMMVLLFALAPFMHGWVELMTSHDHHAHLNAHCSPEAELDACHRLIFHHDHAAGCDHAQHIEQSIQDCSLCAVVASLSMAMEDHHSQKATDFSEAQKPLIKSVTELRSAIGYSLPKRGPPLYSKAALASL